MRCCAPIKARDLWRQIAQAAWECADPGMQFDTTINRWHTAHTTGRINGSNPCSEYMHLDNSACNLASINLLHYLDDDGNFDVDAFRHTVEIIFTAQEILVGRADYPTPSIAETSREFRQLGLGYANLGAMLMALGLPYDSADGRAWAAAITSLMTGHAYATSARTASRMGPFAGFADNEEHMLRVLRMHRDASYEITDDGAAVPAELLAAGQESWEAAVRDGEEHGVRNSQASVLAPTGTIGLMMDCDTTGIEPDLGLVKMKKLVGGGTMSIVNQTIPRALRRLGYTTAAGRRHHRLHRRREVDPRCARTSADAPGRVRLLDGRQHDPLRGPRADDGRGAAVPVGRHLQDGQHARGGDGRRRRGAAPAVVGARPQGRRHLPRQLQGRPAAVDGQEGRRRGSATAAVTTIVEKIVEKIVHRPLRQKLPRSRRGRTFEFRVADCKGFATIGEYDDGRPGEIFLTVSKQGSTLSGIMDAFAKSISYGLQYGVPLRAFVEAFTNMRFEPAGMTDDPDIRFASSIMDYLFRRLAIEYLSVDERAELSIFTVDERMQPTLPGVDETVIETSTGSEMVADPKSVPSAGELADQLELGTAAPTPDGQHAGRRRDPHPRRADVHAVRRHMIRAGSCHACPSCGSTSGCS